MLVAFLIMLREGIEAALIVGIVAGFLKQSGYSHMMPKVWIGVVAAALMCLGLGLWIHNKTGEIPQKQQEFVVGALGLFAVAMLTYMVLWMKKASRSLKQSLQQSVSSALQRGEGHGWALVSMAFLAVAREGLESVFFLIAVFNQAPTAEMPLGAVLGLVAAAVIGYLIYKGGVKINLGKFFQWTGVWNIGQTIVFDSSHILHNDSVMGVLMGGFFGYTDHPVVSDLVLYVVYLVTVLYLFFRQQKAA